MGVVLAICKAVLVTSKIVLNDRNRCVSDMGVVLAILKAVLVMCKIVLNDRNSCVSNMIVVLAICKAVLVMCKIVLNDATSCVSDMDSGVSDTCSKILTLSSKTKHSNEQYTFKHGEKRITPSCRAELETGVGGDEDVTERSEHPGEQVVQSERESAAHNTEQLNLRIGIYLSCHILFLTSAYVSLHSLLSQIAR
jgi:hypothetical protein